FYNQHVAFRVKLVERIFRVSWKDNLPAPTLGEESVPVTSILRQKEGLVPLLDFESITTGIGIGKTINPANHSPANPLERANLPIVFADDSRMVSELLRDNLLEAGFENLHGFSDGEEAWQYLL